MSRPASVDCERVDELAGAVALGAVDPDEQRAVASHLDSCERPHVELRELIGVSGLLAATLEPIAPSPQLRARVMASVAATRQEHAPASDAQPAAEPSRRGRGWLGWLTPSASRGLAAAALAAFVVLAAWNVGLQGELGRSREITQALADARAVYPVSGEAGRGLLLDTPDGPRFLTTGLEPPPSGRLYELWLIGEDGVPVDVGVVGGDGVAVVPVEDDLAGYVTFAVTVEAERVDAPTSDPVMVADIGSQATGS